MSFRSEMEREKIYEEMEHSSGNANKGGIFSKLLSIALLVSIGFASGSIYQTFQNASSKNEVASQKYISNNTLLASNSSNTQSQIASYAPNSIANIVAATADSVVEITQYTTTTLYQTYNYTQKGNGSGVIISNDGYILTNNHVISGAEKITVRLRNGEEYEAKLIGKDSKTDTAIIKIDAKDLKAAVIGDSSKTLVGDFVLAIGNPLGQLGGTVTYGYVSALEREITIDGTTRNLMQVDAAVNPGNSGGGLFNCNGELIGIVSAKSTGYDVEGIGFAIPVNDISTVIDDLLTHGYATNRPFLGVSMENSSYSSNNNPYGGLFGSFLFQQVQYGAKVASVVKDSPAEKADIKVGDIIISIAGKVVSSASEVTAEIGNFNVGDEVEIGLIRDGRTLTVKATLTEYKGE